MNFHDYFIYDPEAGNLIHKERPRSMFKSDGAYKQWHSMYAGKVAGYKHKATDCVFVNVGKMRKAHRIIYEMMVGPIPPGMLIDHKNKNGCDNRLENLRLATKSTNGMNRRCNKNNTYGLKGVSMDKRDGAFQAEITVAGRRINLGRYLTKGMAAVAYAKAALRYHGEFARIV